MTTQESRIDSARRLLESLRKSQLKIEITASAANWFSVLFILLLTAALFEMMFYSGSLTRSLFLLFSLLLLILASTVLLIRLVKDPRLKKNFESEEWWALTLGRTAPESIRDRLLNALQVNTKAASERDSFSAELARHALYEVVYDLQDVDSSRALNSDSRTTAIRVAAGVAAALLLTLLITPGRTLGALDRLMHPRQEYKTAAEFSIDVRPRSGWTYRGEPREFQVIVEGKSPNYVEFIYQYAGGNQQSERVRIQDSLGVISFDGLMEPMTYFAKWKDVVSPVYNISVVSRPQIAELQYRLIPPKYSRLQIETGRENVGDVEALPGSRLELGIRTSKHLRDAWLIFLANGADSSRLDTLPMAIKGLSASVGFMLMKEGKYNIRLRDRDGHPDKDPVTYRISLLADDSPSVRIVYPDGDVELGDDPVLPVAIQADDDFGINRMEIAFKQMEVDSQAQSMKINLQNPGAQSHTLDYFWDIGELFLMPGDVVEYWIVVWDNDNVNGPKIAESEHRLVRLPSMEEILTGVAEAEEKSIDQVENSLEAAKELREAMNEIIEEMKRNPDVDWERRRQVEDAMESQKAIQEQIEKLAKTIDDLVERLEKHDLLTPEILEKYRQLQELISEVATPEMKEAMEKLRKALEEQNPEDVRKALEQFNFDRESFLQNIDKTMNILKQLQLERRLDELVKQVEEILHSQEEVISKVDESDLNKLAGEQTDIQNSMSDFEKNLERTAEMSVENGENQLAQDLGDIDSLVSERAIRNRMLKSAADMKAGKRKSARENTEQTARDLSDVASRLSKVSEELKQRRKDELARKIRRIAEELLYVSEGQEELAEQSKELGTQSPRYRSLAGQQGSLKSSLDSITMRLFEIGRETFFITPALGASLGKASRDLDTAIDRYTGRSPRSASTSQKNALGEINRAVMQLINILEQLQSASSSSGYEEMLEQLSQMASSQQGLNQQSMPMPGLDGEQTMPGADQMSRMAAQQRALQKQMEKLAEEGEGMREILGDLDGIAKNMGEVADDLEEQNVEARTRRLQEQIVSRLLDATRSARQKEYSRKRESKIGEDLVRRSPQRIQLDSDAEKLRRDLKRALQEGYTRDYRRLIRAYFQALEKAEQAE